MPLVQDAQTIEDDTKNEIDSFLQPASEFNKVDAAATKQKNVDFFDKLFGDMENVTDSRQTINDVSTTEDIFTDDGLFDDDDKKDAKYLADVITSDRDISDILFKRETVDVMPSVP